MRASGWARPRRRRESSIGHNKLIREWWRGEMWITSSPVVDLVYRMRDYFRENFDYVSLRPTTSTSCSTRTTRSINGI